MAETAAKGETAADPRFRFLSSIIGRPVRGPGGARLGKLTDLVVATGEPYPLVESLVLKGPAGRRSYPWTSVEHFDDGGLTLKADAVGSTSGILKAAHEMDAPEFIVATDNGMMHKLRTLNPGKIFIEAPTAGNSASCKSCAHCPWMAMNGLAGLAQVLELGTNEDRKSVV